MDALAEESGQGYIGRGVERIKSRDYTIGVVGLGYVGIPLAVAAMREDFFVIGFDVDQDKVETVNAGRSPIKHLPHEDIAKFRESNLLTATTDFSKIDEVDAIIICVPTPLTKNREPDLSYVEATLNSILPYLRKGHLLVLESTTYPGTTHDLMVAKIEENGLICGKDVWVAYSPEREDPGNINFETAGIPKVIGGQDEAGLRLACTLYDQFV